MMRYADTDVYSWFDTANSLRLSADKSKSPLIGAFELTARCNLACKMCYVRRENSKDVLNSEKSAKDWINLAEQVAKEGTLFLLITGGEPLIRKDFRQIYEAISKMGFIITLFTNATLVDEKLIDWISKSPPNKVGITLYGASSDTYERITGNKNAYYRTLSGIDLLIQAGITVQLRTTITRNNICDIGAIDEIAWARNLKINHVYSLTESVRGALSNVNDERLSPKEITQLYRKNLVISSNEGTIYTTLTKTNASSSEAMFCSAGKSSYWVSWDGRMLPCALMDMSSVDVFNAGFISAWEEVKEITSNIKGPEECKGCEYRPYCGVCPAKLQAETGSFEKTSPYICGLAKAAKQAYNQ